MTFQKIFDDFAQELASTQSADFERLAKSVLHFVSSYERQTVALSSSANVKNDWDGTFPALGSDTEKRNSIEDIIRWFSFAVEYHLLGGGQEVLQNTIRYPAPSPPTRFSPPPRHWNDFDDTYHHRLVDALRRAATTQSSWDFICAALVLRWFLRMSSELPKASWLGLSNDATPEKRVPFARDRLSNISLEPLRDQHSFPDIVGPLLTVLGWGKGFGEYSPTGRRIFVEPVVCRDDQVANLVEIVLYPFVVRSRRSFLVWTRWAGESQDAGPPDEAYLWPYLNAEKWPRVIARRRAAVVWAGARWATDDQRKWGRRLLVECARYGWKVKNLNEMIQPTLRAANQDAATTPEEGDLERKLRIIRTAIRTRELRGLRENERRVMYNVIVFGFSRTGKTTMLHNLVEQWYEVLRLQGDHQYEVEAGWEKLELNREWLRVARNEDQTDDPISITLPFSTRNGQLSGVRCIDIPGEWFEQAEENRTYQQFLEDVMSEADLCIVLRPLKNVDQGAFADQVRVLGKFVSKWREVWDERVLVPAIFCCLNWADEARDWNDHRSVNSSSPMLLRPLRSEVEHDLEVKDLLSSRRLVPIWLNSMNDTGDLCNRVTAAIQQFVADPNFRAERGGLSLAVVGGTENVPDWGNRKRLTDSDRIAAAVRSLLESRWAALDQERSWAHWIDRGTVSTYYLATRARAIWDTAIGRVSNIPWL